MRSKRSGIATLAALFVSCVAGVAAGQSTADVPATPCLVIAPVSLVVVESAPAKRPAVLPALYAALGAVNAWDMYSTSAALKAGAVEGNPVIAPVAGNTGMLGLKLAAAGSTILFAERLWKKNRVAAIVMMAAINGATAAVAVRNIQNARTAGRHLRAARRP